MKIHDEKRALGIYEQFRNRSSRDDEFTDWEGYRSQLTGFIINNTAKGSSLLILGAGKCNDIDLKELSKHCGSICLSDYRPETAEEAFSRYDLKPSETVKFSASDYAGISDEDYISYTTHLIKVMEKLSICHGESPEDTAGYELKRLLDDLDRIYKENKTYRIDLGDAVYDNAVMAGIHSQLNNSFRGIFQYVRKDIEDKGREIKFLKELNSSIFEHTRKHTADIVRRFNKAAFATVREGVIYGYEKSMIYTPEGETSPVIGTVDGARQAGEEVSEIHAKDQMKCLWPLSKRRGIKFEMDILYLAKDFDLTRNSD